MSKSVAIFFPTQFSEVVEFLGREEAEHCQWWFEFFLRKGPIHLACGTARKQPRLKGFSKDWAGSARCLGNACQGPDFTLTAHFSWEQTCNSLMLCAETLPTTSCFLSLSQAEESTLQGPGTALGSGRAAPSSECLMPLWSPLLVRAEVVWMRGWSR